MKSACRRKFGLLPNVSYTGRQAGCSVALSEPPKVFFSRAHASPTTALIHPRATPHRPRLPGLTGPIAAREHGHPACYRHGINEQTYRPTWHLASSRCCAGNGPEFLATMAAVMKMSLRRARWLVLCRRACVALDALLKTPRLCPLVRVSVRTMRLLLIAR
jgi:hypothetical protein